MNNHTDLKKMAMAAKTATLEMAKASLEQKNGALEALIGNLRKQQEAILQSTRCIPCKSKWTSRSLIREAFFRKSIGRNDP
jgi:hypothetical protein